MRAAKLCIVALTCLSMSYTYAQTKIGYINSLELLSYMPEIKQADSTLQLLAADLQKQYGTYVLDYQQKLGDYKQNAGAWSDVIREAKEKDLQDLEQRITDYEQTSQQKIADKKKLLYDPVVQKANDAIQAVGKENKLTCVMDSSTGTLIYVGTDMIEIMPMVKQKLNLK
jgi:outer membrane protein